MEKNVFFPSKGGGGKILVENSITFMFFILTFPNGVRPNFAQQPRMNNGAVRPNNPAQRPPNFNNPASQQDKDDENYNDSTSQPLPSFGNPM